MVGGGEKGGMFRHNCPL